MVTTTAPEPDTGSGGRGVLSLPASAARRARRSAASTPGRLFVIGVGLVVLALLTGLISAMMLQQKQRTVDGLIEHREPVAAASQQLYRALSDADATAASAFLAGGNWPPELLERYERDIAQAGANLAEASADAGGVAEVEAQVDELARHLPVYTGLVETARAYNRQGYPAGAAYLREASGLMRANILPAAERLYTIDFDRLAAEQEQARAFPWASVALVVVLLAALIITQRYLTRRTNRLINVGMLVATCAVVIGLIWGSVALLISAAGIADGSEHGTKRVELVAQARIVALKMRANETLTLVARGSGAEYEQEWQQLAGEISGDGDTNLLVRAADLAPDGAATDQLDAARGNAENWVAAHAEIRKLDEDGSYQQAVGMAIGDADDSAAVMFNQLDSDLLAALNSGREEFVSETGGASRVMTGIVPGVGVLALVVAAGVTIGIRERLREYR